MEQQKDLNFTLQVGDSLHTVSMHVYKGWCVLIHIGYAKLIE